MRYIFMLLAGICFALKGGNPTDINNPQPHPVAATGSITPHQVTGQQAIAPRFNEGNVASIEIVHIRQMLSIFNGLQEQIQASRAMLPVLHNPTHPIASPASHAPHLSANAVNAIREVAAIDYERNQQRVEENAAAALQNQENENDEQNEQDR